MILGSGLNFEPSFLRDFAAFPPTLHSSVVGMSQLAGHLSDAPKAVDHFPMGFHSPAVRSQRTSVNAENVQQSYDNAGMAKGTVGEKLMALRERSKMSMDAVARAMKLSGRSSVQRLFVDHLEELSPYDAIRLADAMEGKGDPPITREEILNLSAFPLHEVRPNDTLPPKYMQMARDVPVYGTAMGTYREGKDEQEIEQAFIDSSDIIDHLPRPPSLVDRQGIYGLYAAGCSMEPRWEAGDPMYIDPKRPPAIGDDVVVYLMKPSGDDHELEAALLKRLVRQSASFVELEQFNPPMTFRVERRRIKAIHRVIPRRELLAFH